MRTNDRSSAQPHAPAEIGATRNEHDLLSDRRAPAHAYYGVQTLRAMENFPITEITGIPLVTAVNLVEATQDCGAFVQLSGEPKRVASASAPGSPRAARQTRRSPAR
jgi:aspartate ammonia-lyase